MNIIKERTRIKFIDYTDIEKDKIEELVGTMDKVFTYEDPDGKFICLPTGMWDSVKKLFPKAHYEDNSKEYWDFKRFPSVQPEIQPRNQLQSDYINFVIKNANEGRKVAGILSPGVGKTFMSCYSAIMVGMKTLIIAPTSGIKDQWGDTLTGMFKINSSRVCVVRNPKELINCPADFVIVSQATLQSLNKTYDLEAIMKNNKFGIKVIDEVQMWFHNIIKVDANCNFKNNWYITGTFGRSGDEENKLYQEMFGDLAVFREKDKAPTLFNRKPGNVYGMKPYIHCKMVWGHSGLSKEEIKSVTNSMRYSERAGKWMRYGISIPGYTKLIVPSDGTMTPYLKMLLNTVAEAQKSVKYGRTLVLMSTIDAAEIVCKYLRRMYPNLRIETIHSRRTKEENDDAKAKADIIVSTTKSAGTGFDVKDLSRLVVSDQFKSWILADQISGRLRRRPDERECYMWDIVDADIKQLRVWANARADVLRRKCKTFKVEDYK